MAAPLLAALARAIGPAIARMGPSLARSASANAGRGGARALATRSSSRLANKPDGFIKSAYRSILKSGNRSFRRTVKGLRRRIPGVKIGEQYKRAQRAYDRWQQASQQADAAKMQAQAPGATQEDADRSTEYRDREKQAREQFNAEVAKGAEQLKNLTKGALGATIAFTVMPSIMKKIGDAYSELLRNQSQYSVTVSNAFARFDWENRQRDRKTAQENAPATRRFLEAQTRLRNALQPVESAWQVVQTRIMTSLVDSAGTIISILRRYMPFLIVLERLADILGRDEANGDSPSNQALAQLLAAARFRGEKNAQRPKQRGWNNIPPIGGVK